MAMFSNALPALAHLEAGAFRLDRYYSGGEAWTYPAADWTVRLDPVDVLPIPAAGF